MAKSIRELSRPVTESGEEKLSHRVIVGFIFIPLIVFLIYLGGAPLLFFTLVVGLLALREFYELAAVKGFQGNRRVGYVLGGLVIVSFYLETVSGIPSLVVFFLVSGFLAILGFEVLRSGSSGVHLSNVTVTFSGVIYTCATTGFIILLRELPHISGAPPEEGAAYLYLPFLITWSADTGAYFAGRKFGRVKLAPRVSPGKTIEGVVGGIVAAALAALLARFLFAPFLTTIQALILGILVAAAGIFGDLAESLLKRDSSLKDSSALIPGHGGILDRFDSLFFAVPVAYYIIVIVTR